ncbi:MAG: hypothetical protein QM765_33750 [Myxococcales bacterium]
MLRTLHRMAYEHGLEVVMGHLLVPVRDGLFEVRVLAADQMTGYRESVLTILLDREGPKVWPRPQSAFDDPKYDERFAQHCLSRVRAGLRAVESGWSLRVEAPPKPNLPAEVELIVPGCALVPPPRFVFTPAPLDGPPDAWRMERVSFCGTDGVESLVAARVDDVRAPMDAASLEQVALQMTRQLHEGSGVEGLRLESKALGELEGRPHVLVVVEGRGHRGALRNVLRFFADDRARLWQLGLVSSPAVPVDELAADLELAVRSFRLLGADRPWWKFW